MAQQEKGWDTSYEWKIILLLSITFGLVGLDRFVLPIILQSPNSTMAKDLGLTPQDGGTLATLPESPVAGQGRVCFPKTMTKATCDLRCATDGGVDRDITDKDVRTFHWSGDCFTKRPKFGSKS